MVSGMTHLHGRRRLVLKTSSVLNRSAGRQVSAYRWRSGPRGLASWDTWSESLRIRSTAFELLMESSCQIQVIRPLRLTSDTTRVTLRLRSCGDEGVQVNSPTGRSNHERVICY